MVCRPAHNSGNLYSHIQNCYKLSSETMSNIFFPGYFKGCVTRTEHMKTSRGAGLRRSVASLVLFCPPPFCFFIFLLSTHVFVPRSAQRAGRCDCEMVNFFISKTSDNFLCSFICWIILLWAFVVALNVSIALVSVWIMVFACLC